MPSKSLAGEDNGTLRLLSSPSAAGRDDVASVSASAGNLRGTCGDVPFFWAAVLILQSTSSSAATALRSPNKDAFDGRQWCRPGFPLEKFCAGREAGDANPRVSFSRLILHSNDYRVFRKKKKTKTVHIYTVHKSTAPNEVNALSRTCRCSARTREKPSGGSRRSSCLQQLRRACGATEEALMKTNDFSKSINGSGIMGEKNHNRQLNCRFFFCLFCFFPTRK